MSLLRVMTFCTSGGNGGGGGWSVDVLVDGGVMLVVDDDAVVVADGGRGCQRLVRGRGVMVVVAGCGHEHGRGRRVTAAAGLMRQLHAVTLVRAGAAGGRTERPRARLVVRVELKFRVTDVLFAREHVGRRNHVQLGRMVVARAVTATDGAVDQRLRFLHHKRKMVNSVNRL